MANITKPDYTAAEREVVYLKAIQELVDSMVNHQMFKLSGNDPDSSITFKTMVHQQLFYILLVDFLSESSSEITGNKKTYLDALKDICASPCFDVTDSVNGLRTAVKEFADWLDVKVSVDTYLSSIIKTATLSLRRGDFIYICGNISKHNFTRLSGVRKRLCEIMEHNNISISYDESLLIMNDFYGRFHDDILIYHASTIAEFLNNIRWGIHEYLQPEYSRSVIWQDSDLPRYSYTYPDQIRTDFAKNCYWELMNTVRSKPFVRRFQVTRWYKLRY